MFLLMGKTISNEGEIMQFITNWVKNIILLILLTTFLMMFLPESNFRKYVRVIMGFFIISIFITPFAGIFRQDIDFLYGSLVS